MPELRTVRAKAAFLTGFVLLANLPDFPLPGWGHRRYLVSHSLFVNLALIAAAVVVLSLWSHAGKRPAPAPVVLGGAVAWLSHLLLDCFYSHGQGLAIWWPFSQARLALPVPWFDTLQGHRSPLDAHTLRVCLWECVFWGPILLIAILWRRRLSRKPAQ